MPSLIDRGAGALAERMRRRLEVEDFFARSGRTLRKSRSRLWWDEGVKPKVMAAVFRVTGLYSVGRRNALSVRLHSIDLDVPGLPPAFDNFTILHISDLHIDKLDGLAENVARVVAPLRPDLCVLTGDYRYEIRGDCSKVYPSMQVVLDSISARYGILGILGNHDAAEIAYWLAARGVRMLMNDAVQVEHRRNSVWIAGVDDPYDYRCDDLNAALKDVPAEACKVLLAHTPGLYRSAAERGVKLYLCGHTHAGQIRLPGIGAVKKNGPYPRAFVQDKWMYNGMQAYTSWGAGCSTLPVRFFCPPEVALLRLRVA